MASILSGFASDNPIKFINNQLGETVRQITSGGSARAENSVTNDTVTPTQNQVQTLTADTLRNAPPSVVDNYRTSTNGRPSRELGEPETETIATISVATDTEIILSNYSQFFLLSVSEGDQEKYQVVETFTAYYVFFFGRRPPVYRFSGMLLNDQQFNWMNDFRYTYNNLMRGTAAAEIGARVIISYDKRVVSCFPLSLNISQDAQTDKGVPFSMDVLVISHELVDYSTDLKTFMDQKQNELRTLKNQIQEDIKRMSKDVNADQAFIKQLVLKKNRASSSVSKAGQNATSKANPASEKKGQYDTSPTAGRASAYIKVLPPQNVKGTK